MDVSLLVGYVWADEPRATAAAVLTGTNPARCTRARRALAQQYWDARASSSSACPRARWPTSIAQSAGADHAARRDLRLGRQPDGRRHGRSRRRAWPNCCGRRCATSCVAGIADRPATDACYAGRRRARRITLKVGGDDRSAEQPGRSRSRPRWCSSRRPTSPPSARPSSTVDGVTVVLTARRRPFHEIVDFTSLGLDPTTFKIVVVKAGYLVPADRRDRESEPDGAHRRLGQPGHRAPGEPSPRADLPVRARPAVHADDHRLRAVERGDAGQSPRVRRGCGRRGGGAAAASAWSGDSRYQTTPRRSAFPGSGTSARRSRGSGRGRVPRGRCRSGSPPPCRRSSGP